MGVTVEDVLTRMRRLAEQAALYDLAADELEVAARDQMRTPLNLADHGRSHASEEAVLDVLVALRQRAEEIRRARSELGQAPAEVNLPELEEG